MLYPRLRAFENRMLRRVFGPERDEVRGEWRKLYNTYLLLGAESFLTS
jgi:hypothetical protein